MYNKKIIEIDDKSAMIYDCDDNKPLVTVKKMYGFWFITDNKFNKIGRKRKISSIIYEMEHL